MDSPEYDPRAMLKPSLLGKPETNVGTVAQDCANLFGNAPELYLLSNCRALVHPSRSEWLGLILMAEDPRLRDGPLVLSLGLKIAFLAREDHSTRHPLSPPPNLASHLSMKTMRIRYLQRVIHQT